MHANTRNDPFPVLTTNGFRRRKSFGRKIAGEHLSATRANMQAAFHLSRPDAKVVLLAADFDVDVTAPQPDLVEEVVADFNARLALRTFIEPSRNRRGRYSWIKVLIEESREEFNRKLKLLNRRLRKLIGTKYLGNGVGFDAIKGTMQFNEPNDLFDPFWARQFSKLLADELDAHNVVKAPPYLNTNEKLYEWHKSYYRRGEFQRQEELERYVHRYGVLITAPLCGARNDGDAGEDRWIEFWLWEMDDNNIIPSSELWAIFGIDDEAEDDQEDDQRPPAHPSGGGVILDHESLARHAGGLAWQMLTNKECKLQSSNGAASIALAKMGGPQPANRHEDLRRLTRSLYVQYGAATGDPTPERYARLDEALNHFIKTWNPTRRARPRVTLKQVRRRRGYWLSILSHRELKEFCAPQTMVDFQGCRFEIRRKLSIDHRLLAAAELACWRLLSRTGTIPVQSLHRELKKLKMSRDGKHYRAILTLFARRGIFCCINALYRFDVPDAANDWNKTEGEARQ